MDASTLVDLVRYPLADLRAPATQALVDDCRQRLATVGAVTLEGFLTPEATAALTAEARGLEWAAHEYHVDHTVYFQPCDASYPRRTCAAARGSHRQGQCAL